MKGLATLLASLIAGDRAVSVTRHPQAVGGLLVLIARASGTMDLPVPTLSAFRQALLRFGSVDDSALASLYRQHRSERPARVPNSTEPVTVLPLRTERPTTSAPRERRIHGARRSDLRREIRRLDLELFQRTACSSAEPLSRARAVVAALLATAALAASFIIGVNVIGPWHQTRSGSSTTVVPAVQTPPPPMPSKSAAPQVDDGRSPAAPTPVSRNGVSVRPFFSPSFAKQDGCSTSAPAECIASSAT